MKNSLVAQHGQPLAARPTTTIVTVNGRPVPTPAHRLCRLPDGSLSTVEGYFDYDRQQTHSYFEKA